MDSFRSTRTVSRLSLLTGMSAASSPSVPNTDGGGGSPFFFASAAARVSARMSSERIIESGLPVRHQETSMTRFKRSFARRCHFSRNFIMLSASRPVSATCSTSIRFGSSSAARCSTCS